MRLFYKITFLIPYLLFVSCGIYSFTGASISNDIKTIEIHFFNNYAPVVNPKLSQTFTQDLQDLFLKRTNLSLVDNNGDLAFEGEITNYEQSSVGITGDNISSQIRLTIEVNVRFYNNKDDSQNFEKKFRHYEDIEGSGIISGDVEDRLVSIILERLLEQIFNDSVANW